MKRVFLVAVALLFVGCAYTSGTHLAVLSGETKKNHQIDNTTIRGKVASLNSIRYLYAEHPIHIYNVDERTFLVPVGGHLVDKLNSKLLQICEDLNGSAIEETVVIDSFTNQKSIKESKANAKSNYFRCINEVNNFTVAQSFSLMRRLDPNGEYYPLGFTVIITEKPEKPQMSYMQYNTFVSGKEDITLTELLDSKFSMMTALGNGIALSHDKIGLGGLKKLDDGSYEQTFTYDPDRSVVDPVRDYGIISDLNAFCSYHDGYLKPITNSRVNMFAEFGKKISNTVNYQCNSPDTPFYFKFKYTKLAYERPYKIVIRRGTLTNVKQKNADKTNMGHDMQNSLSEQGLKAMLKEKLAKKMDSSVNTNINGSSSQLVTTVNFRTPHAVMDNPNYVLDIYWIRQNGNCENISIVKTYKYSNDTAEIKNYLKCNGRVKRLQNTNLPVLLPDNLRNKQDSFMKQVQDTGSLVYVDSYSGITVIGRKADNYCKSYLFYMKNNQLLKAVQGGC
ncbi:hypothetical protein [Flexistipes sp.]|uniref:hypothetical protein n=1 Tax=Flexistipes sp. TaxID=3088135 RepID=UPI002E22F6C9|nr:hypothetical protein [Flexistipes sp.]